MMLDFANDVRLAFDNAILFNPQETPCTPTPSD